MSDLERRLRSVARRLRATRALEEAARFALLAAPLGLGAAVARTLLPHGALAALPAREALLLALAPAALGGAAGALAGALGALSRARVAAVAEERGQLGAAFTTALELGESAHPWRPPGAAEAEEAARTLEPALVAPLGLPPRTRTLALVVLTTLAILFLPVERLQASGSPPPEKAIGKPALDAIAKAGAQLRQSSEALPPGESRRQLDDAGRELRTFLSDLESGELGKRDALARLGEAEERLRVETARQDARTAVRQSLAADRDLAGLARANAPRLDALAAKLAADPHAREAAKDALQAAARAAEATPELKAPLERAARAAALARGPEDKEKLAPALADLAKALAEQPSVADDAKAHAELAKAHQALEEARSAVSGDKPDAPPAPAPDKTAAEKLADKIPPELLAKALADTKAPKDGAKPGDPGLSPEDAKKLLDKLPAETLEKLAKAAQEAAPGKMADAAEKLPEDVKKDVAEAAKKIENEHKIDNEAKIENEKKTEDERGIPPEALAKMAEMIPPELLAKAMKMKAESANGEQPTGSEPPRISPEDAQKLLENLSPRTIEKLAKAAMEAQRNAPAPSPSGGDASGGHQGLTPEQAQEIVKKLSPETLAEIQKAGAAAQAGGGGEGPGGREGPGREGPGREGPGEHAGTTRTEGSPGGSPGTEGSPGTSGAKGTSGANGSSPGTGTGTDPGKADSGKAGVLGRQGDSAEKPGRTPPDDPAHARGRDPAEPGPGRDPADDKDPLVKNRPRVGWSQPPEQLPSRERDALRAALEKKRVPASYERSVREYFDLGKP